MITRREWLGSGPRESWSTPVKALHWTLVLALLLEVPAGFLMSYTYGASFRDRQVLALHDLAAQIHHTTGFLVFAAAILWIMIRLRTSRPPLAGLVPTWQRWCARAVQGCLLALLVLVPWSGWTALSALADSPRFGPTHLWFFTSDGLVPRIWPPLPATDPAGYARFAHLHGLLLRAGLALLLVHAGSALWHEFVRRDGILGRMWPRLAAPAPGPDR